MVEAFAKIAYLKPALLEKEAYLPRYGPDGPVPLQSFSYESDPLSEKLDWVVFVESFWRERFIELTVQDQRRGLTDDIPAGCEVLLSPIDGEELLSPFGPVRLVGKING